jgi:hypothetical protein
MNTVSIQQMAFQNAQGGFGAGLLSEYQQRDQFDVGAWLRRALQQSERNILEPVRVVPEEVKRSGFSSLAASPEAGRLREYLQTPHLVTGRGSIFDLPPLNLGRMLRSLDADDDLLSEMLDDAWL